MVRWRNVLAGALALVAAGQAAAQAPDGLLAARNLVILDGRVGHDGLAAAKRGLAGTGHAATEVLMQTGDCGAPFRRFDAQELAEREQAESAQTGRFDLDTALRAGARTADGEPPANVILVANGPSACISIACALAASFAKQDEGTRISVIGTSEAASGLRCLAEYTGGQFQMAAAGEIEAAVAALLVQEMEIVTVSVTAGDIQADPAGGAVERLGGSATPQAEPEQMEGPATSARPDGFTPVPKPRPDRLQASQRDGEPAQEGRPSDEQAREPATPRPFQWANLPPGAPEQEVSQEPEGPGVSIRVLAGPWGPVVEAELTFDILSPEGSGTYRLVDQSSAPHPYFALPKGQYVARVTHREVIREFPFAVSSDNVGHQTFSLDLGYLSLRAVPSEAAAPLESGISYTVYRLDGGSAAKALLVRTEAQPMIALPAGRYRVLAQLGATRSIAEVEIKAGETLRHHFDLNLGYLRVTVDTDAQDVTLQVERLFTGGQRASTVVESEPGSSALFRLPAGRYMAVASATGTQTRQIVTVQQGQLANVVLEMQTAADEPPQH